MGVAATIFPCHAVRPRERDSLRAATLLRDVDEIERFLKQRLSLTLHPKKRYFQLVSHGIPFIGATVYPGYILPSRRAQNKAFLAAYRLVTEGEGDPAGILSRMGCLKHINSRRLFKRIFDSFGWEYDWVLDLPEKTGSRGPSESGPEEKPLESPPDALQRQMPLFALPEAQPKKPKTRSQPSRGHQRPVWKQTALIPQKGEKTLETGSREATGQKAKRRLLGAGVAFGDFISAASPRPRQGSAKKIGM